MLEIVKKEFFLKKNLIIFAVLVLFFFGLYTFLDFEGNTNYKLMTEHFGIVITLTHILINIIIALLSAYMVTLSTINYNLTKKEPKGANAIPFLTFIFGLLTFGCTGCVVAFFTAVGIAFTPIILPNGNLIWKLAALLLVILGYIYIMYSIKNMKCKIKD